MRRIEYDVRANWKLILQNYNECLHCPTIHPGAVDQAALHERRQRSDRGPIPRRLHGDQGAERERDDDGPSLRCRSGTLTAEDQRRAFYYALFPTMMLSLHPGLRGLLTRCGRSGVEQSRVVRMDGASRRARRRTGYNIQDAEEFWDRTNRQDWHICEQSQLGISSRAYAPGPYSPRESIPGRVGPDVLEGV